MRSWQAYRLIASLERRCARVQGKGYGGESIGAELRAIERLLGASEVRLCVDVGANVGDYTAGLRDRFPQADVMAFEPARINVERLERRFGSDELVTVLPVALSDVGGEAILYTNEPGSGLASLTRRDLAYLGIDHGLEETVRTVRFEDFWDSELERRSIDVLKLDVEGNELAALVGAGAAIEHTRIVQFEFGGCNIDSRTYFLDFWTYFSERSFEIYRVTPMGVMAIEQYRYYEECFGTTNFLALRSTSATS